MQGVNVRVIRKVMRLLAHALDVKAAVTAFRLPASFPQGHAKRV